MLSSKSLLFLLNESLGCLCLFLSARSFFSLLLGELGLLDLVLQLFEALFLLNGSLAQLVALRNVGAEFFKLLLKDNDLHLVSLNLLLCLFKQLAQLGDGVLAVYFGVVFDGARALPEATR